jgi:hypothetical protein
MNLLIVKDKHTQKNLNMMEILEEVNRDRSDEWTDYTIQDIFLMPEDIAEMLDPQYYDAYVMEALR